MSTPTGAASLLTMSNVKKWIAEQLTDNSYTSTVTKRALNAIKSKTSEANESNESQAKSQSLQENQEGAKQNTQCLCPKRTLASAMPTSQSIDPLTESLEDRKSKCHDVYDEVELDKWEEMEMSTYGTSAVLTGVSTALPRDDNLKDWRSRTMTEAEKDEVQKANDLMDQLDREFEPTIKPGRLTTSLDDEDGGDSDGEAQRR